MHFAFLNSGGPNILIMPTATLDAKIQIMRGVLGSVSLLYVCPYDITRVVSLNKYYQTPGHLSKSNILLGA